MYKNQQKSKNLNSHDASWVMRQTWNDLLFVHWPIPVEKLRNHVPNALTIDTYEGFAWLGIVPFWMNNIQLRGLPPIPYFSSLKELNVRTYINQNQKPGVYFFSLDASKWLHVEFARKFYHLPYLHANINLNITNSNKKTVVDYYSVRKDSRADSGVFHINYQPISEPFQTTPNSLEHWLTERYCLYNIHQKKIFRVDIDHQPWTLQHAKAHINLNTLHHSLGVNLLANEPLLHFSKRLDVQIYRAQKF